LLYGETPSIGYEGREMPEDEEYRRHYVGIFNPKTNEIELHVAPRLHFSRMIKAHIKRDRLVDGKGVVMSVYNLSSNLWAHGGRILIWTGEIECGFENSPG